VISEVYSDIPMNFDYFLIGYGINAGAILLYYILTNPRSYLVLTKEGIETRSSKDNRILNNIKRREMQKAQLIFLENGSHAFTNSDFVLKIDRIEEHSEKFQMKGYYNNNANARTDLIQKLNRFIHDVWHF
jgi:hypothetical protein